MVKRNTMPPSCKARAGLVVMALMMCLCQCLAMDSPGEPGLELERKPPARKPSSRREFDSVADAIDALPPKQAKALLHLHLDKHGGKFVIDAGFLGLLEKPEFESMAPANKLKRILEVTEPELCMCEPCLIKIGAIPRPKQPSRTISDEKDQGDEKHMPRDTSADCYGIVNSITKKEAEHILKCDFLGHRLTPPDNQTALAFVRTILRDLLKRGPPEFRAAMKKIHDQWVFRLRAEASETESPNAPEPERPNSAVPRVARQARGPHPLLVDHEKVWLNKSKARIHNAWRKDCETRHKAKPSHSRRDPKNSRTRPSVSGSPRRGERPAELA